MTGTDHDNRYDDVVPVIELTGICKSFGPVRANSNIDLKIMPGTIHGIVGENGAGKSTLMSILYGFYQADSGTIRINGKACAIREPRAAIAAGIGMVHQHFKLVDNLSVVENVILGAEDGVFLSSSLSRAAQTLSQIARDYELEVDPSALVGDLSVGLQQRVEILKALYRGAQILILDEPTGVLTPAEADHLFGILDRLRGQGKTVVLITHKLREIMAITDTVSVMRRGEMTAQVETGKTSAAELARLMVGRPVFLDLQKPPAMPGEIVLAVNDLTVRDGNGIEKVKAVSFTVRAGEIVGIAGVAGNGQSEILDVIAGVALAAHGSVRLNGQAVDVSDSGRAARMRKKGVAHVPEDRHRAGLVMSFAEWENSILGKHTEPENAGAVFIRQKKVVNAARAQMERFYVRPCDPYLKAENFSGGNQQKIVLAREMDGDPALLLVGQPTRGVDIGAIEFIHRQIVAMRDAGKSVLLVSVELEEIMSLCDRILVMFDGRITGERSAGETSEKELGLLMAGMEVSR